MTGRDVSSDEDDDVTTSSDDVSGSGLPRFFYGRASEAQDRHAQTDDVSSSRVYTQTDDVGTPRVSRDTAVTGRQ